MALEKLDLVAAPAPGGASPLQAVLGALRATQAALLASQAAAFGATVGCRGENPRAQPQKPRFSEHPKAPAGLAMLAHMAPFAQPAACKLRRASGEMTRCVVHWNLLRGGVHACAITSLIRARSAAY